MSLPPKDVSAWKNAKMLRRIVKKTTNILVKMTDISGRAKKLASGAGFAYNDK